MCRSNKDLDLYTMRDELLTKISAYSNHLKTTIETNLVEIDKIASGHLRELFDSEKQKVSDFSYFSSSKHDQIHFDIKTLQTKIKEIKLELNSPAELKSDLDEPEQLKEGLLVRIAIKSIKEKCEQIDLCAQKFAKIKPIKESLLALKQLDPQSKNAEKNLITGLNKIKEQLEATETKMILAHKRTANIVKKLFTAKGESFLEDTLKTLERLPSITSFKPEP